MNDIEKLFDAVLEALSVRGRFQQASFFFQGLFYFPKSVKVDFSICCLAQGRLTGSKEGETGAAG